jgi:TolB protein
MPYRSRTRSLLKGVALAVGMAAVASAGAGAALAAPAVPAARSATVSSPVASAGLGWSLAEYSTSTRTHPGRTTLYAVSPQGRKYAVRSWSGAAYYLLDWSGDGRRALLSNYNGTFEQINVRTGMVVNRFRLPKDVTVIGYTRPEGENLLAYSGTSLVRYNLEGTLQKVLAKDGTAESIESPDGLTVIAGTTSGIKVISNLGGVTKRLSTPIASGCGPVRWWNQTTVLAACVEKHGPAILRLWLFPVNGGRVRALTTQRHGRSPDLGDVDAWKLTSGVYTQALGACGTEFIAKQWRNGSAHEVPVPGYDNIHIVTGYRTSLLVQAQNPCGIGNSLLWFNPASRSVKYVFHTPDNVAGVISVVPFGRPLS